MRRAVQFRLIDDLNINDLATGLSSPSPGHSSAPDERPSRTFLPRTFVPLPNTDITEK